MGRLAERAGKLGHANKALEAQVQALGSALGAMKSMVDANSKVSAPCRPNPPLGRPPASVDPGPICLMDFVGGWMAGMGQVVGQVSRKRGNGLPSASAPPVQAAQQYGRTPSWSGTLFKVGPNARVCLGGDLHLRVLAHASAAAVARTEKKQREPAGQTGRLCLAEPRDPAPRVRIVTSSAASRCDG
jgi:hypothetical protein